MASIPAFWATSQIWKVRLIFPSEEPPELPQPERLRANAITRIMATILVRILMFILLFVVDI